MYHAPGPRILLVFWLLQSPECVCVTAPRRFKRRKPRYRHGCTWRWTVGFMTQDLDTVAFAMTAGHGRPT